VKLLFVDPNKTFHKIVATVFADTAIEIGFAETSAVALCMATEGWQFVCLSLHIADGDGLMLCRALRKLPGYRYTPIILFTSDTTGDLQLRAAQAGVTEVFLKSNVGNLINFVSRYSARVQKFDGRILYVEDSPAQALLLQAQLATQGLTVQWCASGEEAWAAIEHQDFDLVLTDLVLLNSMSGSALISRIRSLAGDRGDTPIIAITAFDNLSRRIELFHLGVNDYVTKPVIEEELMSRVRNLVERRTATRAMRQQRKRRFDETLISLSRSLNTAGGELKAMLQQICRESAATLGVSRVGIWLMSADRDEMMCRAFHDIANPDSAPVGVLAQAAFPIYFEALLTERILPIIDACTHPVSSELAEPYLIPNGIGSLLDVPLGPSGRRSGVLCHEHAGGCRTWTTEEESFAAAVGDLVTLALDAHERWLANQQLRLAGLVFEAASEAILICDSDHRVVKGNDAFALITGYTVAELVGCTPTMFAPERHGAEFHDMIWREIAEQGKWQGDVWDRKKDGTEYSKRLSISRVLDTAGQVSHYIVVFTDISQEKADQEQLRFLAYNDVLTELPNRLFAESALTQMLVTATDKGSQVAVLCIDIDRFKKINSSFGHGCGDSLLKETAQRIRGALCRESYLARWSGAGFIAVLDAPADAELAVTMAQRCMDAFRVPFAVGNSELNVTLSIGIGLFPQHGRAPVDIIKNTMTALNHAKDAGGNRYVFFNADMEQRTMERLLLESRMRRAIDQHQFVVHYQPKVNAATLQPVGSEALVRWNDPTEGLLLPARFLGLAEDTGQIYPINHWVLHEACRQNAEWHFQHGISLPVAVNLPAGAFAQGNVAQDVRAALADTGLPPALLELELTESAMVDDPQRAFDVFTELKALGVRILIDDFGTGYSSLAYLQRLPIDVLKIDRSFIVNLNASDDERVIVSTIIGLARSLKLRTVAEGIERETQRDILRDLGCDEFQGYLFGRPMAAEGFLQHLRNAPHAIRGGCQA
jgi:diguanylate cyclase (GGDEF)-like protein/PAS domain S-box-containing protein